MKQANEDRHRVLYGIAGWSYDDWRGVVYPKGCKDTLVHCARLVDCIEINSTFYHVPNPRNAESWARRTATLPVVFTAKIPRLFTHDFEMTPKAVSDTRDGFAPLVSAGKLHALLLQFSYRFEATGENLAYLRRLCASFDDLAPLAVEVRHRSWTDVRALDAVRATGASLVHLDYPGATTGFGLRETGILGRAGIAYLRLHGRNRKAWFSKQATRDEVYDYDYSPAEVREIADRVHSIARQANETVVIGNNHFRGQGLKVALELMALDRGGKVEVPDGMLRAYPELRRIATHARPGLFDRRG